MPQQQVKKTPRIAIDGVILLDKVAGISSNDALIRIKRLLHAKKAGHTGTLDPFATGLLPLCFGQATKFSQDLLLADKTYETVVHLGVRTDTADTEGEVIETKPVAEFSLETIESVLSQFRGCISQIPPMYSALKRDGKPLYAYAREGITLERESRSVEISQLICTKWESPFLHLTVTCSKGTYIRVLGEDIGNALGCGAHLNALRRTKVGSLSVTDAFTEEQLQDSEQVLQQALKPVDSLLQSFEAVHLDENLTSRFINGQRLPIEKLNISTSKELARRRVYEEKTLRFLGTALVREDGILAPERLINTMLEHQ